MIEDGERLCTKCGTQRPATGQRWCRACKTLMQRLVRARKRDAKRIPTPDALKNGASEPRVCAAPLKNGHSEELAEQTGLRERLAALTDQAEAIRQHPRRYPVAASMLLGPLLRELGAVQRQLDVMTRTHNGSEG